MEGNSGYFWILIFLDGFRRFSSTGSANADPLTAFAMASYFPIKSLHFLIKYYNFLYNHIFSYIFIYFHIFSYIFIYYSKYNKIHMFFRSWLTILAVRCLICSFMDMKLWAPHEVQKRTLESRCEVSATEKALLT